jgi:hypothetical protein
MAGAADMGAAGSNANANGKVNGQGLYVERDLAQEERQRVAAANLALAEKERVDALEKAGPGSGNRV